MRIYLIDDDEAIVEMYQTEGVKAQVIKIHEESYE